MQYPKPVDFNGHIQVARGVLHNTDKSREPSTGGIVVDVAGWSYIKMFIMITTPGGQSGEMLLDSRDRRSSWRSYKFSMNDNLSPVGDQPNGHKT